MRLFIFLVAVLFTAADSFAQGVATDKLAYQPGDAVTITGEGWQPQERVTLLIGYPSGTAAASELDVNAGTDGGFTTAGFTIPTTAAGNKLTLIARAASGAEVMTAFTVGTAPGSLRCSSLAPSGSSYYGISASQKVTCTIEGATDLSPAQRAGTEGVEVAIKSATLGYQRATVLSVSDAALVFEYTAPRNACGTSIVSYGPIKTCDAVSGKCTIFPTEGNDTNSSFISGKNAAGFTYLIDGRASACPSPLLKVEKIPKNGSFAQGGKASYKIVVTNPGSNAARCVRLTDLLPSNGGLVWEDASTTTGTCVDPVVNNALNCNLGDLSPGAAATVTVTTTDTTPVAACQRQPNPAAVATAAGGVIAFSSAALTCTPSFSPQLKVTTTPKNGAFSQSGQASYSIEVGNPATAGAGPAEHVQLTDQLPTAGGLTWATATTSQGNCSVNNSNLNCSLGTIPAQGSATVVVSTPATTPPSACLSQRTLAVATASGGLTAQDGGALTCSAMPCTISGVTIANTSWNGFDIPARTSPVVWVHAHLGTPTGIPVTSIVTVRITGASINVSGSFHALPDALLTFDPASPAPAATKFNAAANRWETVVNSKDLSNEIFLTGAAIPVTAAIAESAKATLSFTVLSQAANLSFPWQWSAAVYTYWPPDWSQAQIEPYHGSYHAGAPMNAAVQKALIPGPRGGGGSNFTGSWSATGNGSCH